MGNNPGILYLPERLVKLHLEGRKQNPQLFPVRTSPPHPRQIDPRLQSIEQLLLGVNLPVVGNGEGIASLRADIKGFVVPCLWDVPLDDPDEPVVRHLHCKSDRHCDGLGSPWFLELRETDNAEGSVSDSAFYVILEALADELVVAVVVGHGVELSEDMRDLEVMSLAVGGLGGDDVVGFGLCVLACHFCVCVCVVVVNVVTVAAIA